MPRHPRDPALPTWRSLIAEARRCGVPRRADDTTTTLAARLAATPEWSAQPRLVTAIVMPPTTLDRIERALLRSGGRRVAADVALIPRERVAAVVRLARRHGIVIPTDIPSPPEPEPAVLAATKLVDALAVALAWPSMLRPPAIRAVPAPLDPNGARQMDRLLHAWRAALDTALDPAAETPLTPNRPRARPGIRAQIESALRGGHRLTIEYHVRSSLTRRVVRPLAWEHRGALHYVHAFCELRDATRLFRLDRIASAEPAGST